MSTDRPTRPFAGSERETLLAFLDHHRATLLVKTEGLDAAQLAMTLAPSEMTLGGMLKHCALNEDAWFCHRFAGLGEAEPWASVDWEADEDWDWDSALDDSPEELDALLRANVDRARSAIRDADLDTRAVHPVRNGEHPSLRWIILHMIEEYARHNGHADLIRESIDGSTGE